MKNSISRHVLVVLLVLIPLAAQADPAPPQITSALLADLDTTVLTAMETFDVPGAAVALMQDGQVVYAKGFGVRNLTTGQPFTPDTVFRIASTTKSMTAMLVATQVDQGLLDWDTPVHTIYPAFRLPRKN